MNKELIIDAQKSFIGAWFMDDLSLCDDIILHFEQSKDKAPGKIWRDDENHPRIDAEEKDSVDLNFDISSTLGQRYIKELQKVLTCYKIKYPIADKVASYNIESINIQKYKEGASYKQWHTERSGGLVPGVYRHLVFMTYLNDVVENGETEFFHQKVKIKPTKGLTVIWPADWTHLHRGIPSETKTKYIATGWYCFTDRN